MIQLDADETRLLLAAKDHDIKGVKREGKSHFEFIQAVCNLRCGVEKNASVFYPYLELASKLLSVNDFVVILDNWYRRFNNPFLEDPKIDKTVLARALITALALRRVTDLTLDKSLI